MAFVCCGKNCSEKTDSSSPVVFFKFPKNQKLKKRWSLIVKDGMVLSENSMLCSKHFHPSCFNDNGKLKADAVPTLKHRIYRTLKSKMKQNVYSNIPFTKPSDADEPSFKRSKTLYTYHSAKLNVCNYYLVVETMGDSLVAKYPLILKEPVNDPKVGNSDEDGGAWVKLYAKDGAKFPSELNQSHFVLPNSVEKSKLQNKKTNFEASDESVGAQTSIEKGTKVGDGAPLTSAGEISSCSTDQIPTVNNSTRIDLQSFRFETSKEMRVDVLTPPENDDILSKNIIDEKLILSQTCLSDQVNSVLDETTALSVNELETMVSEEENNVLPFVGEPTSAPGSTNAGHVLLTSTPSANTTSHSEDLKDLVVKPSVTNKESDCINSLITDRYLLSSETSMPSPVNKISCEFSGILAKPLTSSVFQSASGMQGKCLNCEPKKKASMKPRRGSISVPSTVDQSTPGMQDSNLLKQRLTNRKKRGRPKMPKQLPIVAVQCTSVMEDLNHSNSRPKRGASRKSPENVKPGLPVPFSSADCFALGVQDINCSNFNPKRCERSKKKDVRAKYYTRPPQTDLSTSSTNITNKPCLIFLSKQPSNSGVNHKVPNDLVKNELVSNVLLSPENLCPIIAHLKETSKSGSTTSLTGSTKNQEALQLPEKEAFDLCTEKKKSIDSIKFQTMEVKHIMLPPLTTVNEPSSVLCNQSLDSPKPVEGPNNVEASKGFDNTLENAPMSPSLMHCSGETAKLSCVDYLTVSEETSHSVDANNESVDHCALEVQSQILSNSSQRRKSVPRKMNVKAVQLMQPHIAISSYGITNLQLHPDLSSPELMDTSNPMEPLLVTTKAIQSEETSNSEDSYQPKVQLVKVADVAHPNGLASHTSELLTKELCELTPEYSVLTEADSSAQTSDNMKVGIDISSTSPTNTGESYLVELHSANMNEGMCELSDDKENCISAMCNYSFDSLESPALVIDETSNNSTSVLPPAVANPLVDVEGESYLTSLSERENGTQSQPILFPAGNDVPPHIDDHHLTGLTEHLPPVQINKNQSGALDSNQCSDLLEAETVRGNWRKLHYLVNPLHQKEHSLPVNDLNSSTAQLATVSSAATIECPSGIEKISAPKSVQGVTVDKEMLHASGVSYLLPGDKTSQHIDDVSMQNRIQNTLHHNMGVPFPCLQNDNSITEDFDWSSLFYVKPSPSPPSLLTCSLKDYEWKQGNVMPHEIFGYQLFKENFLSRPIEWLVRNKIFPKELTCLYCPSSSACLTLGRRRISECYWECLSCRRTMTFIPPPFFQNFDLPLENILSVIYHWAFLSDFDTMCRDTSLDAKHIADIYDRLRNLCSAVLHRYHSQLGGEKDQNIVEVIIIRYSEFHIMCAMEQKTQFSRFKVLPGNIDQYDHSFDTELNKWIRPNTCLLSVGSRFKGFQKEGLVHLDKDVRQDENELILNPGFHVRHISNYIRARFKLMFSKFNVRNMNIKLFQQVLDELQWRERFGHDPVMCFNNMLTLMSGQNYQRPSLSSEIANPSIIGMQEMMLSGNRNLPTTLALNGSSDSPEVANRRMAEHSTTNAHIHSSTSCAVQMPFSDASPSIAIKRECVLEEFDEGNISQVASQVKKGHKSTNQLTSSDTPVMHLAPKEETVKIENADGDDNSESSGTVECSMLHLTSGRISNIPESIEDITTWTSLLSISTWPLPKDLSSINCDNRARNLVTLRTRLEKKEFFSCPVKYLNQNEMFFDSITCTHCFGKEFELKPCNNSIDGYSWVCIKNGCKGNQIYQKPKFLASLGLPVSVTLPLVFHWVIQSRFEDIVKSVEVTRESVMLVYSKLQELCSKSITCEQCIGMEGETVEVGIVRFGVFFVLGILGRKSKHTRLKVLPIMPGGDLNIIEAELSEWIHPASEVVSPFLTVHIPCLKLIHCSADEDNEENQNKEITEYLDSTIYHLFGKFCAAQLSLLTMQLYLDEVQWRQENGANPIVTYENILALIAQYNNPAPLSIENVNPSTSEQADIILVRKRKEQILFPPKRARISLDNSYETFASNDDNLLNPPQLPTIIHNQHYQCHMCEIVIEGNVNFMHHAVLHVQHMIHLNSSAGPRSKKTSRKTSFDNKPYVCQICPFRSASYPSFSSHFARQHGRSSALFCRYCLMIFYVNLSRRNVLNTEEYCNHLKNHCSGEQNRCKLCPLFFLNYIEFQDHQRIVHNGSLTENDSQRRNLTERAISQVPRSMRSQMSATSETRQDLFAPSTSATRSSDQTCKVKVILPVSLWSNQNSKCLECNELITRDHYSFLSRCPSSSCPYVTYCSQAFNDHWTSYHSEAEGKVRLNIPYNTLKYDAICYCDFTTRDGFLMAHHLNMCKNKQCVMNTRIRLDFLPSSFMY